MEVLPLVADGAGPFPIGGWLVFGGGKGWEGAGERDRTKEHLDLPMVLKVRLFI